MIVLPYQVLYRCSDEESVRRCGPSVYECLMTELRQPKPYILCPDVLQDPMQPFQTLNFKPKLQTL